MDDDFSDLESALRGLRPRALPPAFAARVEAALASSAVAAPRPRQFATATSWTSWKWANWIAAAGVVMMVAALDQVQPARPGDATRLAPGHAAETVAASPGHGAAQGPDKTQPLEIENLLIAAEDGGVVQLDDGQTARVVRASFIDTYTWEDPRSHASVRWSLPRDEVRIVPVHAY